MSTIHCIKCKQPGVIAVPNSATNHPFDYCTLKRKALPLSVYKKNIWVSFKLCMMNCAVYTPFYFFQIPDLLYI